MKKVLSLVLVLFMALTILAGCGSKDSGGAGSGGDASVDSFKTFGDIIALEGEGKQVAVYNNKLIYAFQVGDVYYRAISEISDETEQAYMDVDILEDGHEEKQNEIISSIEIDKLENLNEQILSQEELDALVGKTGQDLMDDGWTFSGHNLEEMEFWMDYGPFEYTVTFDGEVTEAEWETFVDEEDTKDLTVKSAVFTTIGDATNIE
ncbi:MAG: hypothetical protein IIY88_07650 [Eubacterium sp.]|nr:hypothetical protein [Eubacterium sp.]